MYDVTVDVYSSRELHADSKLSHRVLSRQPFKVSTASGGQSSRVFVMDFTVLSFCLYAGMRSSITWSDSQSGALGNAW